MKPGRHNLPRRSAESARAVLNECRLAGAQAAGLRSFARCAADCVLYRGLFFWDLPGSDRERTVCLKGSAQLRYRLNRGDIQTVREVWLEECYRPPEDVAVGLVVDLGANIGLTSLWYAKRYGASRVLCVEPVPANALLARHNLASNHIRAEVIEAAIGPVDGTAGWMRARDSNVGRITADGDDVRVVSMESLLGLLPDRQRIDLVKMDIEGGEQALLLGNLDWLERVNALIVEFHPAQVEYGRLVRIIQARGFRYVPAGSARRNSMDFFVRDSGRW